MAERVGPLSVLLDRPCVVCQVRLRDHTAEQTAACCEVVEGWLRPADDAGDGRADCPVCAHIPHNVSPTYCGCTCHLRRKGWRVKKADDPGATRTVEGGDGEQKPGHGPVPASSAVLAADGPGDGRKAMKDTPLNRQAFPDAKFETTSDVVADAWCPARAECSRPAGHEGAHFFERAAPSATAADRAWSITLSETLACAVESMEILLAHCPVDAPLERENYLFAKETLEEYQAGVSADGDAT